MTNTITIRLILISIHHDHVLLESGIKRQVGSRIIFRCADPVAHLTWLVHDQVTQVSELPKLVSGIGVEFGIDGFSTQGKVVRAHGRFILCESWFADDDFPGRGKKTIDWLGVDAKLLKIIVDKTPPV